MAETKKSSTAGKRASSAKSGSAKNAKNNKKNTKRPIRREVGGVVALLLALCVGVSYFSAEDAIFIHWLTVALKGLVGYGYWVMLPALLLAGYILLLHRGRPVRLATASALLAPVFGSALWHTIFCRTEIPSALGAVTKLWLSGNELQSGGVLGGSLAIALDAVLGQAASIVIFGVLLMATVMAALRLTPSELRQKWEERERLEYPEEPEEPALPTAKRQSKAAAAAPVASAIDIPLEPESPAQSAPAKPAVKKGGLFGGFFQEKPDHIRRPDELLRSGTEDKPAAESAAETVPATREPAFPVRESAAFPSKSVEPPVPLQPEPESRGKKAAMGAAAAAAEAALVTKEIQEKQAEQGRADYQFPPVTLLTQSRGGNPQSADAELRNNARRLAETLRSFGVEAAPGEVVRGPSVTRYEFMLEQGVKLSKVTNLADDIALALGASGVRIAPIPNKISVVGVEVPNKQVSVVTIREIIESKAFTAHSSPVCFAVGKDIGGNQIVGDIAKLPHILIAGTTGSGKSVCTNSLIVSLMYKSSPEDVRFIMVDPKMVELAPYNGIPHLLIPVVTDPKKAAGALQWAVFEMMKRYKLFSEHGVKDLKSYNALAASHEELEKLASVVVVIDELADLMLVAAKEVEESICRVAQMGRAAGMHLVIATQRPSADVITGLMKANIPSRIAFAVASSLESRIILDTTGAEKLVGRGDMLYAPLGGGKPRRVQGCMITAEEIERVVDFVKQNSGEAQYSDEVIRKIEEAVAEKDKGGKSAAGAESEVDSEADELLDAAVEVILETGQASVSMLQRRLKLGYSRAARLVDQMEERGIVGP
ncbi:MAG: DNA translocase FtsK, partial [Oscillospiraceae bacterium]